MRRRLVAIAAFTLAAKGCYRVDTLQGSNNSNHRLTPGPLAAALVMLFLVCLSGFAEAASPASVAADIPLTPEIASGDFLVKLSEASGENPRPIPGRVWQKFLPDCDGVIGSSYCHNDPVNKYDVLGLDERGSATDALGQEIVTWIVKGDRDGSFGHRLMMGRENLYAVPIGVGEGDNIRLFPNYTNSPDGILVHADDLDEIIEKHNLYVDGLAKDGLPQAMVSIKGLVREMTPANRTPSVWRIPGFDIAGEIQALEDSTGETLYDDRQELERMAATPSNIGRAGVKYTKAIRDEVVISVAGGWIISRALKTGQLVLRAKSAPKSTAFHSVTSPGAGQGVLNGINPKFLNPDSRFGKAFYISDDAGTTLAELAHHGATGSHTIRYNLNLSKARVLDFTDPSVAKAWGYSGGNITPATQALGTQAIDAGYNVIKFPSLRGSGTNFGVLSNFDDLLSPQMIVPTP